MGKTVIRTPDIIAIVLAVVVIAIMLFAFRGFFGFGPAGGADPGTVKVSGPEIRSFSKQADTFMQFLKDGAHSEAYAMLSAALTNRLTNEEFHTAIVDNGRFSNIQSFEVKRVDTIDGEGWVEYEVRSDAGRLDFTVRLKPSESGEWHVAALIAGGAPSF